MADNDDIAERLAVFLERTLDREGLEVRALRRLSGGASRETWSFELLDALHGGVEKMVLQRVRPGAGLGTAFSLEGEAGLLRAGGAAGVPVAGVIAASDDVSVIGAPFLVLGWADGETIARRILRDDEFATARTRLVRQCAEALAAIHAVSPTEAGYLRHHEPVRQLRDLLDLLGQPHPAFELGLQWLEAHRPAEVEPRVVHGDFRLGNLMVDEQGLRAVLDWELAHLGDPMEDLGWLCVRAWRFGSDQPVAGVGGYDELFAAYQAASGLVVEPEIVRWWEVLGTLRWGVICVMQASSHLTGASRSVELAAIGRRVCENEYDVLGLIGARPDRDAPSAVAPRPPTAPLPELHDAPSAAELIEAVREFLEGDVMAATDGRVRFHARIAGRALSIVERELADQEALGAHQARLITLGVGDDATLAARIRSGGLDDDLDRVHGAVWSDVLAKVRVANPGYLLPGD
jgi:aminoglycoside phosphotransferase (APT) family kinase protein